MTPPPSFRIFVSSPGDVAHERRIARATLERLRAEFAGRVALEPFFWEYEPLEFSKSFQANLPSTAEFDVVLCFLWSRLGSPLHSSLKLPDGSPARSGTEYEIEHALDGQRRRDGLPELHIWVNRTTPAIPPEPPAVHDERISQLRALRQFLEQRTRDATEGSFVASYTSYKTLAEFEELLETKLRKVLERRLGGAASTPAAPVRSHRTWTGGSPYRGLAVFDFEHAPIFFGRTRAIGDALNALRASLVEADDPRGFLLVLGASGSGKSSLARAGILPALVEPGVIDGIGLWRRAVLKPSDAFGDLPAALARALLAEPALPELGEEGGAAALTRRLAANPAAIAEAIAGGLRQAASEKRLEQRHALEDAARRFAGEGRAEDAAAVEAQLQSLQPPQARLALLVDQFEELFTGNATAEQKTAFVAALAALARSGRVVVLATLRSDFYSRLTEFPALLELAKGAGTLHLAAPAPPEIGQMIRLPAQAAGVGFEDHPEKGKLDEVIRDAAVAQAGALPLLEYALDELFRSSSRAGDEVLTHAAYHAVGGVEGAVARRAEETFLALPPAAQTAFDAALRALVTLGEGDDEVPTRKVLSLDESALSAEARELIDAFAAARLLTRDQDAQGRRTVTVAHEAILRVWGRVVEWVKANRDFLRTRARLDRALALWQENGRHEDYLLAPGRPLAEAEDLLARHPDALEQREREFIRAARAKADAAERRRTRLRRVVMAAMAALTIGAVIEAMFAVSQYRQAVRDRERAETAASFIEGNDFASIIEYWGKQMIKDDPGHADVSMWQNSAATYEGIGDSFQTERQIGLAAGWYRAALHFDRVLVSVNFSDGRWQRDYGRRCEKLADALVRQSDLLEKSIKRPGDAWWKNRDANLQRLRQALDALREALGLRQQLMDRDPGNADPRHDVARTVSKLVAAAQRIERLQGGMLFGKQDVRGALQDALETIRRLQTSQPAATADLQTSEREIEEALAKFAGAPP